MEKLLDIARYILRNNPGSTDKQVQKLTYYAYCWYIAKNNSNANNIQNRLVEQHPEAWIHGPVFYDLYTEMTYNRSGFFSYVENIKDETKEFLNKIIKIYGRYTGNQLEDMTHNELPWIEARHGKMAHEKSREPLKDSTIFIYFNS